MTETEWLKTTNPQSLFRQVRTGLSARKLRLLSCGCARLLWDVLTPGQREIVRVVERYADGSPDQPDQAEYDRVVQTVTGSLTTAYQVEPATPVSHEAAIAHVVEALVCMPVDDGTKRAIEWVGGSFTRRPASAERMATKQQVQQWLCDLIREVVGNPFRERAVVRPEWVQGGGTVAPWMMRVSETARALALGIQGGQAYDRMPILADALQDDGCADDELLAHLRDPRPHIRGCWALDLVLGKN